MAIPVLQPNTTWVDTGNSNKDSKQHIKVHPSLLSLLATGYINLFHEHIPCKWYNGILLFREDLWVIPFLN